jgi:hypothetical protein
VTPRHRGATRHLKPPPPLAARRPHTLPIGSPSPGVGPTPHPADDQLDGRSVPSKTKLDTLLERSRADRDRRRAVAVSRVVKSVGCCVGRLGSVATDGRCLLITPSRFMYHSVERATTDEAVLPPKPQYVQM